MISNRKHLVSTLLLFLAVQSFAFGQTYNTTVGIKLKPGVATLYKQLIDRYNYARFSKSAGLTVRQSLGKNDFYIQTGFSYLDRGSGYKIMRTSPTGKELDKIPIKNIESFLNLPVNLVYEHKGFYGGIGPNVNYYFDKEYSFDDEVLIDEKSSNADDFYFGAQVFAGYEFTISDHFLLSFEGYGNVLKEPHYLNYGLGIGVNYIISPNKEE